MNIEHECSNVHKWTRNTNAQIFITEHGNECSMLTNEHRTRMPKYSWMNTEHDCSNAHEWTWNMNAEMLMNEHGTTDWNSGGEKVWIFVF